VDALFPDTGAGLPVPDARPARTDASADGLGLGEICAADIDCASDLCFFFDPTIEEGFCSQLCADTADCNDGEGFRCVFLANTGRDFVRLCAPDNLCIDRDGDGYGAGPGCAGQDCDDSNDQVHVGAPEVCDGLDNNCDGNIDVNTIDANVDCDTGFDGVCGPGRVQCLNGVPLCVADRTQQAEVCDGLDNDCNGLVDDGPDGEPLQQRCYAGPAGTEGVGVCQGGVRLCQQGAITDCLGQVVPGIEICDGLDNDCDGEVDEGNPQGGIACTTGLPGVCAPGLSTCMDGEVRCVGSVLPDSQAEVCDGLDNNCDGQVDEGFPELGTGCVAGLGVCARPGVVICAPDRAGAPVCSATPGTGAAEESCSYVDDNCNGEVDEGFRDASGRYTAVAHCGACGSDCNLRWPGGPALYNVVPTCSASGATAACGFTCAAGFLDADGIADNGCEFQPEPQTVYVSTPANGGVDGPMCGAWNAPCATIQAAIDRAAATPGLNRVRVSTGLYEENVRLANGVSVLGGHSSLNWVQNPLLFGTTLRGADAAVPEGQAADRIAVRATGISAPTEFSGFVVNGINAGPGGNAVAIWVRDSGGALRVVDNEVIAGAGGNGANGAAGAPGPAGPVGQGGRPNEFRARNGVAVVGGAGGTQTCGAVNVSGGAGGSGTAPVWTDGVVRPSGPGASGQGPGGGVGGSPGNHMRGVSDAVSSTCNVISPITGNPGATGLNGADGSGGAGATGQFGGIDAGGLWRGNAGSQGVTPNPGGGGGAPGGVQLAVGTTDEYPTSGGGGGAGGCQGIGGQGGSAGGASVGIMVGFSAPPASADSFPVVQNNRIRRGLGGRGGDGGTGGGGGEGGRGGAGGVTVASTSGFDFCIQNAAPGGAGGRGGHGGGGGGGSGGVSWDVLVWGSNNINPGYQSQNRYDIASALPTGGLGGVGGNSSNTTLGIGGNGVTGASGNFRRTN
jgi:hypothetical protein